MIRKIQIRLAFTLLITMLSMWSKAQQTNVIIPPSPDAAALGMYGNMPVSTYTGVPEIGIPIFNINYRDIHIPVNLSYHASGINVEQDASWVGLGWALNAGGVITRTVRGGDDMQFASDGYSNLFMLYQGYPYDDQNEASGNFLLDVCNKNIDPEPDIFYFNFLGKSGSFVLESGQNSSLSTVTGTPLRAEKMDIQYDKITHKWIIKTADGYSYYFGTMEITETLHGVGNYGAGPESVQFDSQSGGFLSNDDIVVSGWYLDKIVSPLGEEVTYIYDSNAGSALNYLYGSARMSFSDIQQTMLQPFTTSCYMPSSKTSATKIFTFHVYLKEINHSLGKIVFNKSLRDDMIPAISPVGGAYQYLLRGPFWMNYTQAGPQKLDNIEFWDKAGSLVKKVELDYTYFNAQAVGESRYNFKRLKLTKVRECIGSHCKPDHQLFYNETNPLPSKYSNAQDFWGFYNGADNNISRVPYGTYFYQTDNKFYLCGDADRQPNSLFMTSGILNKIIYPTGGSTELEFEPHDYNLFNNDAFVITDFVNNSPVPITELVTAQGDPTAFQTVSFTITEPIQHVNIDRLMNYYASSTASDPCNVVDPGTIYVGNEPWYELKNISTSTNVITGYLSEFLNFFTSNYSNNCVNQPYTPDAIDPIYKDRQEFVLNTGTYELKVYRRQGFNLNVSITKNIMPSRTIPQNANGVFAKLGGGLRVKRIINRASDASVPQIKKYDYCVLGQDGHKYSTGRLLQYPNYHVPFYCQNTSSVDVLISISGRSFSISPLGTSRSGGIVGYDMVKEINGENGENGSTAYYYTNQIEDPMTSQILIEGFPTVEKTSNGLVTDVKHYDNAGNVVKAENYEYGKQLQKDIKGIATTQLVYVARTYDGFAPSFTCTNRNVISQAYTIISDRWVPVKKTEKLYSQQSTNFLQTITEYEYDSQTHLQLKSEQSTSSNGEVIKSVFFYPPDASWIPAAMWQNKFIYNRIVQMQAFKNNILKSTYKTFYSSPFNSYLINKEEKAISAGTLETLSNYTYYPDGNVKEVLGRDGVTQVYFWGYNSKYPVAKILNTTYAIAATYVTQNILDYPSDEGALRVHLNNLRNIPGAIVSTYTYKPLIGMTSETDANNRTVYYEYDGFNRLNIVRDQDGKILKKYCYNYAGQQEECGTFYNTAKSGNFVKNNCAGGTGSSVTYTVPANVYSASSQTAADALAQSNVNTNGQAYANQNGACVFSSSNLSGNYYSAVCTNGATPQPIYINVPAGMFTSTTSLADANSQAYAYAQNYANTTGTCSSGVEIFAWNDIGDYVYVELQNTSTSQYYYLQASAFQYGSIGTIPAGNYNITVTVGSYGFYSFGVGCYNYSSGPSATFYNITINSSCNSITTY